MSRHFYNCLQDFIDITLDMDSTSCNKMSIVLIIWEVTYESKKMLVQQGI